VLQRAVLHVLEPLFEREFLPSSFGYRSGLAVADAIHRVLNLRDEGYTWVVDADIRDCFPSLDHELILALVGERVMDQDLLDLIALWLPYGRPHTLRRSRLPRGISLGGVVSPLLCNIYLHQLDLGLARAGLPSVRYADDFVVLCRARWERDQALDLISAMLAKIRLEVNQDKTRLTTFDEGFTFLGVAFEGRKYRYEWYGKQVEAEDLGETFPLEIDGYR
jgi:group II intron reverse transcriptase/maturase